MPTTTEIPPKGRIRLWEFDDYEIRWNRTSRGVTVWLVERGHTRQYDHEYTLGSVFFAATERDVEIQRAAFWEHANGILNNLFDEYPEVLAEVRKEISKHVPIPPPPPLGESAQAFLTWYDNLTVVGGHVDNLIDTIKHNRALVRWLSSMPDEMLDWLEQFWERAYHPAPNEPHEYQYSLAPVPAAGGLHTVRGKNGVPKRVRFTEEDVERWTRARAERELAYQRDLAAYPARLATWQKEHPALIEKLFREAPPEVRAWLDTNPPPGEPEALA